MSGGRGRCKVRVIGVELRIAAGPEHPVVPHEVGNAAGRSPGSVAVGIDLLRAAVDVVDGEGGAEGSLSKWRGLGVAITRARHHFVEGSASDLLRAEASVESRKWFCAIEETVVFNQRNSSVHSKKSLCLIKGL